jgi:hypothetical protein
VQVVVDPFIHGKELSDKIHLLNKKVKKPKSEPVPAPVPKPTTTVKAPVVVKPGDTLSGIAKANKTTVSALLAANPVLTTNPKYNNGKTIFSGTKIRLPGMSKGGTVPQYMAMGGFSIGTDTVPAMQTPGEFVIRKSVADQYGPLLESINNGTYRSFETPTYPSMNNDTVSVGGRGATSVSDNSSKVYNYSVGISVNNTSASADDIAKVVMAEIKYIDSQRLRGQR